MQFLMLIIIWAFLVGAVTESEWTGRLKTFVNFKSDLLFSFPIAVPISLSSSVNEPAVRSTLAAMQLQSVPVVSQPQPTVVHGVVYDFEYSFTKEPEASIVLRSSTTKNNHNEWRVLNDDKAMVDVGPALESSGSENVGRIVGIILSAVQAMLVPNIQYPPPSGLFWEETSPSISIVAFRQQNTPDPLAEVDFSYLSKLIERVIGLSPKVKSITREMEDHVNVMASLFHARQVMSGIEQYDPVKGRFSIVASPHRIDAAEFLKGIAHAFVREDDGVTQVYVLTAASEDETFADQSRLHVGEDGVVLVLLPPPSSSLKATTKPLGLGVLASLTQVRWVMANRWELKLGESDGMVPEWMVEKARKAVVVFQLGEVAKMLRGGGNVWKDSDDQQPQLSEALWQVQEALLHKDYAKCLTTIRALRRFLTKKRTSPTTAVCERRVVKPSSLLLAFLNEKSNFKWIYALVVFIVATSSLLLFVYYQRLAAVNKPTASGLFGRKHLD